jgi:hypothetical protein
MTPRCVRQKKDSKIAAADQQTADSARSGDGDRGSWSGKVSRPGWPDIGVGTGSGVGIWEGEGTGGTEGTEFLPAAEGKPRGGGAYHVSR